MGCVVTNAEAFARRHSANRAHAEAAGSGDLEAGVRQAGVLELPHGGVDADAMRGYAELSREESSKE